MIQITTLDGSDLHINEHTITMITGQYPHDVGPHTYIFYGSGKAVIAESPQTLVNRLNLPFVKLTRPDNTPIWVKPSAVIVVREPLASEAQDGQVKAVIHVPATRQAIREDVDTAQQLLS